MAYSNIWQSETNTSYFISFKYIKDKVLSQELRNQEFSSEQKKAIVTGLIKRTIPKAIKENAGFTRFNDLGRKDKSIKLSDYLTGIEHCASDSIFMNYEMDSRADFIGYLNQIGENYYTKKIPFGKMITDILVTYGMHERMHTLPADYRIQKQIEICKKFLIDYDMLAVTFNPSNDSIYRFNGEYERSEGYVSIFSSESRAKLTYEMYRSPSLVNMY